VNLGAVLNHARHAKRGRRIPGFTRKRIDLGLAHQSDLETLDCADAPQLRLVTGWPLRWLNSRRVAAVVVLALTFWLIRSSVVPLIWAAIFAIANWPLYRRCAQYLPDALSARCLEDPQGIDGTTTPAAATSRSERPEGSRRRYPHSMPNHGW